LRCVRFSFTQRRTHATQAIAFEWKPGFSPFELSVVKISK